VTPFQKLQPKLEPQTERCYTRRMTSKKTDAKDSDGRKADKSRPPAADNSEGESGLGPVKPNTTGEPPDNLHRRADWFKKRHGGG